MIITIIITFIIGLLLGGFGGRVLLFRQIQTRRNNRQQFGKYISRTTGGYRDKHMYDSREEAEEVLDKLREIVSNYGSASLVDLKQCAGISYDLTDHKYGWTDLSAAIVYGTHGGYKVDLPKVILLDSEGAC